MGRYTTTVPSDNMGVSQQAPSQYSSSPYSNYGQPQQNPYGQQQSPYGGMPQQPQMPPDWPTVFPKPVIGLERNGVFVVDSDTPITSPSQVSFIPGSLDAIRMMRLKGYKVVIIFDEPSIQKGKVTTQQVDGINQYMMQMFGQSGIMSIDGLLYSTSDLQADMYAKPNTGMFNRAETEFPSGIKWKEGWYVGHNLKDAVVSDKIGAKPVILKTGNGEKTIKKMETTGNKSLLNKTLVFDNLLDFANSLE
jgi:D-glycero-D-manno-heptose 1,7-bisphosphate phosphatase